MNHQAGQGSLDWIQHPVSEPEAIEKQEIKEQEISGDVVLEGSLCIADVDVLHQRFNRIVAASIPITIESEGLSRVDGAGVQLLHGFIRAANLSAIPVKWASVSDELRDAATVLGMHEYMHFET